MTGKTRVTPSPNSSKATQRLRHPSDPGYNPRPGLKRLGIDFPPSARPPLYPSTTKRSCTRVSPCTADRVRARRTNSMEPCQVPKYLLNKYKS